jgi:predicted metal-dependent hydrolase
MSDWCHEVPPKLLLDGIAQFNRGEFFEQHETLESLWLTELREVRRLYQGILQIGVGLYQIQRRNHHGAVYMLTRGSDYLRPFSPTCQSVDVADLLTQAAHVLSAVQQLKEDQLDQFDWSRVPRVRFVDTGRQPSNRPAKPVS